MIQKLVRRPWLLALAAIAVIAVVVVAALALTRPTEDDTVVVYNGRAHYGDEDVFADFEDETGIEVELRGGTSPELFERLSREGEQTPADVYVTTDLASMWRAKDACFNESVTTETLEEQVPEGLHDPGGEWWGLTERVRMPVVSTDRVPEGAVTEYADLGDPRFRGRTCLRTSTSEYNQAFVADQIAKNGREETKELLESWMANDPEILGSDGEMLGYMAAGECDVGLSNHYYLGRAIEENEGFPVAPAWTDQDGVGPHANVSAAGLVRYSDNRENAIALMEFLGTREAQVEFIENSEFAANPDVPPPPHISEWSEVVTDPIDPNAGDLMDDAVALMLEVGWS